MTTLNVYAHALEESDERAATIIGQILAADVPVPTTLQSDRFVDALPTNNYGKVATRNGATGSEPRPKGGRAAT